jgi:uncharacterized protein DUF4258
LFARILERMREKVRNRQYVMTLHAEEEMVEDGLTLSDVERTILVGKITERQRDLQTDEWKYRLRGDSTEAIAKIGPTGKLVIITVYAL